MKILVTGSAGFIGGYIVRELLNSGYSVVGIDNFSKYGPISSDFEDHPQYRFVQGDAKDAELLKTLLSDCDQVIAGAALVGGIGYFHEFPYDILAENERILASTFDASIWAKKKGRLKKINVLSSSMVFESVGRFPYLEGDELRFPPPSSSYGFQKLAAEYFAKAAFDQYGLNYTIIRPFNCIGVGEHKTLRRSKTLGNRQMTLNHVVPDLIEKVLDGLDPLPILGDGRQTRHFTYGKDLAKGIRLCLEAEKAVNQDFNLSSDEGTTILKLAEVIFKKINPNKKFSFKSEAPLKFDVQNRTPDTQKAKSLLGFQAETPLEIALEEIISWIKDSRKMVES